MKPLTTKTVRKRLNRAYVLLRNAQLHAKEAEAKYEATLRVIQSRCPHERTEVCESYTECYYCGMRWWDG